jgi:hypothetical protein
MMDKNLARRNIRLGIVLFVVLLLMLAITFVWAALYIRAVNG